MLDLAGVYTIACDINGRLYVGATAKSFRDRWYSHLAQLGTDSHGCCELQADWNAFGSEQFSFAPYIICEPNIAFTYELRAIGLLSRQCDLYNGQRKPRLNAIDRLEARHGKTFRELMMPYVEQRRSPEFIAVKLGLSSQQLALAARRNGFRVVRCYDLKDE